MTPGLWTEADAAELDVLLWALVSDYFDHRQQCRMCLEAIEPCPSLRAAITEVLNWRTSRVLLSRAEALRAEFEERTA
jgi:hypothetical protein